ncbi:PAQR family membrane homeostasis protein TrhA [Luteibaculum oceani]|uniref:Hemolysin III family protein n=1 Tax=Luteibaculum oceani TaxID=1294296 RepID=A0A5C6VJW4_9FLAO|nr:hemolysin III family protein [Luteibaculum oceani]TXC85199.1 hemolysin III family protein [Luteibaculum oceani]
MRQKKVLTWYDKREEQLNIWSHALGALLSLVACFLLIAKAQTKPSIQLASVVIYSISMLLLYLASTLYHSAKTDRRRRVLNIVDHAAIYLLIAGTYTPFCLIPLMEKGGISLLIIVWSIALVGVVLKLFFTGRFNLLSTLLYVAMGWLVVFRFSDLMESLSNGALYTLGAGGLAYTLGAVLYSIRKLPYNHAIFHFFVLLGSAFHFSCIYLYLL